MGTGDEARPCEQRDAEGTSSAGVAAETVGPTKRDKLDGAKTDSAGRKDVRREGCERSSERRCVAS